MVKLITAVRNYQGDSSYVLKIKEETSGKLINHRKYPETLIKIAMAHPTLEVGKRLDGEFEIKSVSLENQEGKIVVKIRLKPNFVIYIWSDTKTTFPKILHMQPKSGGTINLSGTICGLERNDIRLNRIHLR